MDPAAPPSPYLQGSYAPIEDECEAVNLPVEGALPRELHGMYVRNGPNPRFEVQGRYHWFDGDGMVHGVELGDGSARYSNRYVRTKAYDVETEAGDSQWQGIMERARVDHPHGPDKDTANTDLIWHAGTLLSTWYLGGTPYGLEVPSLRTKGPAHPVGHNGGMAAHPKVDPTTGELIFFDFSLRARPYLHYGVADAQGRLTHWVPIDVPAPSFFHDLAITKNYTILLDLPMLWDPVKLAQGKRRISFNPELPTRFGVLPRHAERDEVQWFSVPSCYIYHTINAYEDGDSIVMTACRVENPLPGNRPEGSKPCARLEFLELEPLLHRWRLDLKTGEAQQEQLDDVATEFPRINDGWLGRRNRYSYNPRCAPESTLLFDGILKYDLDSGKSRSHVLPDGHCCDEPVFVQRPGSSEEDDGWLTTFVHDRREGTSALWVLDAQQIEDPPIARMAVPRRVPIGFHAAWVPGEALEHPA